MPIRWRLTLFIALVIGAILLLLGIALYYMNRSALLANIENTARSHATTAARALESGKGLSNAYVEQLTLDGVVVIIRTDSGRILGTVNLPEEGDIADVVWREAIDSEEPASGEANISDDPYHVYAVPVDSPNSPARVVEAGKAYESAEEALEVFGTVLVAGIGAAFILSIGGAYFLARAALRPVDAVTSAAREMGEGDLSKR
nr:cell wall metabolism sensor histidine kinase WalK [Actinomycetota bacterium]